jgi:hypothetical protein
MVAVAVLSVVILALTGLLVVASVWFLVSCIAAVLIGPVLRRCSESREKADHAALDALSSEEGPQ